MMTTVRRFYALAFAAASIAAITLACATSTRSAATQTSTTSVVYPDVSWDTIRDPESVGWTRASLDSVRARLASTPTTGFIAIVGGRVLMTYGDIQTVSYLASVRKSVLALMMGNYMRRGTIDLNRTLEELGMDDLGGL